MESIINSFHLDWKLLLAQVVNLGIVIAGLWFLAAKPLARNMKDRTDTITKGLSDAAESAGKLAQAETERQAILHETRQEAAAIINKTHEQAEKQRQELIGSTKTAAAKIITDAEKQVALERSQVLAETQQELASLVVLATEKVLDRQMSEALDESLINQALHEAKDLIKVK